MNLLNAFSIDNDPYFANVVLLAKCNGSNGGTIFTDDSYSPKTLTARGNAKTSTAQSKFNGSSALFDGTGDSVSTPDHTDFTFTGDFTIEFFMRTTTNTTADVLTKRNAIGWLLFLLYGDRMTIYAASGTGAWDIANGVDIGAINTGTWYYVALRRSGSTITGYLGTSGATTATAVATWAGTFDSAASLSFGGAYDYNADWMNGHMAEVRITKGIARDCSVVPTASFPTL